MALQKRQMQYRSILQNVKLIKFSFIQKRVTHVSHSFCYEVYVKLHFH